MPFVNTETAEMQLKTVYDFYQHLSTCAAYKQHQEPKELSRTFQTNLVTLGRALQPPDPSLLTRALNTALISPSQSQLGKRKLESSTPKTPTNRYSETRTSEEPQENEAKRQRTDASESRGRARERRHSPTAREPTPFSMQLLVSN